MLRLVTHLINLWSFHIAKIIVRIVINVGVALSTATLHVIGMQLTHLTKRMKLIRWFKHTFPKNLVISDKKILACYSVAVREANIYYYQLTIPYGKNNSFCSLLRNSTSDRWTVSKRNKCYSRQQSTFEVEFWYMF